MKKKQNCAVMTAKLSDISSSTEYYTMLIQFHSILNSACKEVQWCYLLTLTFGVDDGSAIKTCHYYSE